MTKINPLDGQKAHQLISIAYSSLYVNIIGLNQSWVLCLPDVHGMISQPMLKNFFSFLKRSGSFSRHICSTVFTYPLKVTRWFFGQLKRLLRFFQSLSLIKKIFFTFVVIFTSVLLGLGTVALANWQVKTETYAQVYHLDQVPKTYPVAIILGAKVYADGGLSSMTQDRSDTAIALYQQKKVTKLLVTGDHGRKNYDEVNSIKNYLLRKGIPKSDIFLDHAGFDTYDSLYRAKAIFQVDSAVIITQDFHLPRALFIANHLGLHTVGVSADIQQYGNTDGVLLREKLATMKAWKDVLFHAKPTYLGETIPITGDSLKSWDEK